MDERQRLVDNIAGHLKDARDFIQKRAVSCSVVVVPIGGRRGGGGRGGGLIQKRAVSCSVVVVPIGERGWGRGGGMIQKSAVSCSVVVVQRSGISYSHGQPRLRDLPCIGRSFY